MINNDWIQTLLGPLVLEVTALPTVPQPLPKAKVKYIS